MKLFINLKEQVSNVVRLQQLHVLQHACNATSFSDSELEEKLGKMFPGICFSTVLRTETKGDVVVATFKVWCDEIAEGKDADVIVDICELFFEGDLLNEELSLKDIL